MFALAFALSILIEIKSAHAGPRPSLSELLRAGLPLRAASDPSRDSRVPAALEGEAPGAAAIAAQEDRAHDDRVRDELQAVVNAYAPRIWWHPSDPFGPMDPLQFISRSSLWERRWIGKDQKLMNRGEITAAFLVGKKSKDLFLRYEDADLGTGIVRNWSKEKLGRDRFTAPVGEDVPIFWELSPSPIAKQYPSRRPGAERFLLEYWYHVPYNHANLGGIGNHQGDWEGIAFLVEIEPRNSGHFAHRMIAGYFAAHEGGRWYCPSELGVTADGHPEAFSALGTHATYPSEGKFRESVVTDWTAKGRAWDSWKKTRALVLEPYFGFQGHWGEMAWLGIGFMSGPRAPDGASKVFPKGDADRETRALAGIGSRCEL